MTDLSRDARDLIAQAKKGGLGPSAADRARVRERLTPLWAANAPAPSTRRGWPVRLVSVVVIAGLGALSWLYLGTPAPESSQQDPPLLAAAGPSAEADKSRAGTAPLAAAEAEIAPLTAADDSSRQPQARRAASGSRALDPHALQPAAVTAAKTRDLALARVHETTSGEKSRAASQRADMVNEKARAASQRADMVSEKARTACEANTAAGEEARGLCEPAATTSETLRGAAAATGQEARTASDSAIAAGEKRREGLRAAATPSLQQRPPLTAATTEARAQSVRSDEHPRPPSIEGELELLSAAQSALQQQRPSRALSLLQEHAFRFPTGALSEERMAMQALALCASGRKHAAQTVLVNLEAHGAPSQLLPRVRSQCGL